MRKKHLILISLPSLAIVLLVFVFSFSFHLKFPFSGSLNSTTIILNDTDHLQSNFSLLIGILTLPDAYDRRDFLRLLYGTQSSPVARIDVKFILCRLTKPEQRTRVALEIMRYHDIIILNCTENMNFGKTYTYFSSLPKILSRPYDYVMKADDDVFLRLVPLAKSLRTLPRSDFYYGFVIPCPSMNPFVHYMSGMGYILSWDLVEWIGTSDIPATDTFGPEDKLVGKWLDMGKRLRTGFLINQQCMTTLELIVGAHMILFRTPSQFTG